jgi:glutamyl-tRNA synthetase
MKETVSNLDAKRGVHSGPLVPGLRTPAAEVPSLDLTSPKAHAYLLSFFTLDKKAFDGDIAKFVARNEYLIWQPEPDVLSTALTASLSPFASLHLLNGDNVKDIKLEGGSSSSSSSKALSPETVATPAALADMFATVLEKEIPAEAWASSSSFALEDKVNGLCQRIFALPHPGADGGAAAPAPPKLWGYHFLRWMLFAGKPGPAMVPSMLLLGQDEVLRRVRASGEIAKQLSATQ